ncbi:metallophosphoesterase [Kitasatospora viridis]|uniref:3',5'-cyclic AMP phosphodiesterase CpdA n=1 Tax=Kitasatospora viridis TaxID=281105 RepID=A0A561UIK7_9ACTN|nr:metallophosphoesterase [Kitasatospora viridis]TWF99212.1 3',5'-cyclic AMP phosphodiesterase CpdA [Kitasatospora viridis]
MVLLAQISDLHLDGTARSTERAARVMDYLRALPTPVDALLVTGDIADHGAPDEYREAAELLAAPFPVLSCPGNHDARSPLRTGLLGEPAGDGPVNRLHLVGGAAVLMCDSSVPGEDVGLLDDETLDWIASTLDGLAPGTPALLAFHHPPVRLHHPLPDSYPLQRADRLAELLAPRPQVVALLAGHAHTAAASTFAGRPVIVGPAVTWTLRLPWESDQPADREQPPALAFHVLDEQHRLTTHYRVVLPA